MINDLKLGHKVIKYGLNLRGNLIAIVLFLVLGCVMEFMTPYMIMGSMYMGLASMMLVQVVHSVAVSTMVQSSPRKKRLQTRVPAFVGGLYMVILNTVMIVLKLVGSYVSPIEYEGGTEGISNAILMSSGIIILLALYMGVALKLFWPATIVFLISFYGYYGISGKMLDLMETEGTMIMPIELSILISYLVVFTGSIIIYLIYRATYKLEYSKVTWEAALKRAK